MHQLLSKILTKEEIKIWKAREENQGKPKKTEIVNVMKRLFEYKNKKSLQKLTKDDTEQNWEHRALVHRTEYRIYNELEELLKELL